MKKASKINHVLSEAQYTLMKRASETEFPRFASPVMFNNEAKYVAQYTMLTPLPLLFSPVGNLEFHDKITTTLLCNEKNTRARAFLTKCGETHLAACSKHREEIKQGLMQRQISAYAGVQVCFTCGATATLGGTSSSWKKALFCVLWVILARWKHS